MRAGCRHFPLRSGAATGSGRPSSSSVPTGVVADRPVVGGRTFLAARGHLLNEADCLTRQAQRNFRGERISGIVDAEIVDAGGRSADPMVCFGRFGVER